MVSYIGGFGCIAPHYKGVRGQYTPPGVRQIFGLAGRGDEPRMELTERTKVSLTLTILGHKPNPNSISFSSFFN